MSTLNLSPEENQKLLMAIGAANTVYDLNNTGGANLQVGQELRQVPDRAGENGYQGIRNVIPPGFVVEQVFKDNSSGLDAFIAYNKETNTALVGIAGMNGVGGSAPGSVLDTMQADSGMTGQIGDLFKNGGLEKIRELSLRQDAASFQLVIGSQSGAGPAADTLVLGVLGGLDKENQEVQKWNLRSNSGSDPYAPVAGIDPSNVHVFKINTEGTEVARRNLGMMPEDEKYSGAYEKIDQANIFNAVSYDPRTGLSDPVNSLNGSSLGVCVAMPAEPSDSLSNLDNFTWRHRIEGATADFLEKNNYDLNAMVRTTSQALDLPTSQAILDFLGSAAWKDNQAAYGGAAAELLIVSAFSMPGETARAFGKLANNFTGGAMGEDFLTAVGGVLEAGAKLLAFSNPTGFIIKVLTLFGGSWLANQVMGSPAAEQAWLATLPALAEGGTRQTFSAVETGNLGGASVVDTYADHTVYYRQDGIGFTQNNDGSYSVRYADKSGFEMYADGGGRVFVKNSFGNEVSLHFGQDEAVVPMKAGGFEIVSATAGRENDPLVRLDASGQIIELRELTQSEQKSVIEIQVDTQGDGVVDSKVLTVDDTSSFDLFDPNQRSDAEYQLDELHAQGQISDQYWQSFTLDTTHALIDDIGVDWHSGYNPYVPQDWGMYFDPIGAFYDSQSKGYDQSTSIAAYTPVVLDALSSVRSQRPTWLRATAGVGRNSAAYYAADFPRAPLAAG